MHSFSKSCLNKVTAPFATACFLGCFLACFLGLSGTTFAATALGIHELRISGPGLVADDPSCAAQTTEIASSFAQQAGVSVVDVACRLGFVDEPIGVITYAAPQSIDVFNTNAAMYDHFDSGYATAELCAEALSRELPLFTRHTGLTPFAAYCHRSPELNGAHSFRTAIYAINTVDVVQGRKYSAGFKFDDAPMNPDAIANVAFDIGQRAGLDMLWTGTTPLFSGRGIAASYYGNQQLYLLSRDFGYAHTEANCDAMAAQLNRDWAASGTTEAHFFCMDALRNVRRLGLFWWSGHALNDEDFSVTQFSGDHSDQASCDVAKEAAVAKLTRAGEKIIASLCGHVAYPYPDRPPPPLRVTIISR
jgi:hypothetical protein